LIVLYKPFSKTFFNTGDDKNSSKKGFIMKNISTSKMKQFGGDTVAEAGALKEHFKSYYMLFSDYPSL